MIRVIDLRGQGVGSGFALYDTEAEAFLDFFGYQVFDSKQELGTVLDGVESQDFIDRVYRLLPDWADGYIVPDDDY